MAVGMGRELVGRRRSRFRVASGPNR